MKTSVGKSCFNQIFLPNEITAVMSEKLAPRGAKGGARV